MEHRDKTLLEAVTLCSIVIALSSFGTMLVATRDVIENRLMSESMFMGVMLVIGVVTLVYGIMAIRRYHSS